MKIATAIINRHALQHNLKRLRELVPSSKLILVIKANAYGHGLLETAKILTNADAFCVSHIEEAIKLRDEGIIQPILLLEGFFSSKDLSIVSTQQFQTIIHNLEQLQALEKAKLSQPIITWMKIDTGMHRLGVRLEQAETFYQRLTECKNVQQPVNIVSHFSRADELECNVTENQIKNFDTFCKGKPGLRSIAASSGILFWPKSYFDCVRPGIILYGISPLNKKPWGKDLGFKPAMSLTSSLIAVREHKANEPVGYGGIWISKRDTFLGIVAIGYGDGYPRSVPYGTPVLINGYLVKVVGHVNMDMVCVDLGQQALGKVGDPVTLWGDELPVEYIAQITGISAYELITRLTSRVVMDYVN